MKTVKQIFTAGLIGIIVFIDIIYLLMVCLIPVSHKYEGNEILYWSIYLPAAFVLAAQPHLLRFLDSVIEKQKPGLGK